MGWVGFSLVSLFWIWSGGTFKADSGRYTLAALCAVCLLAELAVAASSLHLGSDKSLSALGWAATLVSYAGASVFVAATTASLQLISVAFLMWLVAITRIGAPSTKLKLRELSALWAALCIGCAARSKDTSLVALVLVGVVASAVMLALSARDAAATPEQSAATASSDRQPAPSDTEQSWAQHDSILHDLSNAMTASLFMVRDLSRALDKGTEPGLRRARSLSQELVGELSQIGEHIKSSRQSVRLQPIVGAAISVVEPIERCVELVARLYPDVRCCVESAPAAADAMVAIIGGEATLKRIVENLVINACQAERAGETKEAVCRVAVAEDTIVLTVEDNGVGFASIVLESHPSPKVSTKPQGTGIGLYSCHQLVKRDGGTLTLSNPAAGGARVTISWPRALATPPAASGPKEPAITISGTRARPDGIEREPSTTANKH